MGRVQVKDGWLQWNGREIPLYAAEFHYWRNDPAYWPDILQAIREAHFTVVTSFVQWNAHETAPGVFDFEGRTAPQRNLPRFLEAAQAAGLYAHLRPGPACCEWRISGGTAFATPWRDCYDAYWRVVAPYAVTAGGPLLLQQIHNEWFDLIGNYDVLCQLIKDFDGFRVPPPAPWLDLCAANFHILAAGYDFDHRTLAAFLEFRYGTLDAFADAWGPEYGDWSDPVRELERNGATNPHAIYRYLEKRFGVLQLGKGRLRPLLDHLDWLRCFAGVLLRGEMDHVRQQGCDLPLSHNWPMMETQEWNRLAGIAISGYDLYQTAQARIWDWLLMSADAQTARFPYMGEFMTGSIERYMWGGQGVTPENWERFSKIAYLAQGVKGFNLYMFVERDNWLQCPVDERGGLRPSYDSFARINQTLAEEEWHKRERLHDVCVLKFLPYHEARTDPAETGFDRGFPFPWFLDHLCGGRDPKEEFKRLFRGLHDAQIDFATRKVPNRIESLPDKPVLLCYALAFMDRRLAEELERYVHRGGHLLLYPEIPCWDLDGNPLTTLQEAFGIRLAPVRDGQRVAGCGCESMLPEGVPVQRVEGPGLQAVLTLPDGSAAAGWLAYGSGQVLVAGYEIGHTPEVLRGLLLDCLGARCYASTGTPQSGASVSVLPGRSPLVCVYNGHFEDAVEEVRIEARLLPEGEAALEDCVTGNAVTPLYADADGVARASVRVAPRDATIFRVVTDAPPPRPAPGSAIALAGGHVMREDFSFYETRYALSGGATGWPRVDGGDWTFPALAHGNTYGIQGWFWLVRDVMLPSDGAPVRVRASLRGWHNLAVVYVNGIECGRQYAESPGGVGEFDVTAAVRTGRNRIAVRLLRQSLDCHDKGASGFEFFEIRSGNTCETLTWWHLAQERLDAGESEGWFRPESPWSGGEAIVLPWRVPLQRSRDVAWLRFDFESAPAQRCRIALDGSDLVAVLWLNGRYAGKTPVLPVELPVRLPLNGGPNTLTLRVMADPFKTYDAPRDTRFRNFALEALDPMDVHLTRLAVRAEA